MSDTMIRVRPRCSLLVSLLVLALKASTAMAGADHAAAAKDGTGTKAGPKAARASETLVQTNSPPFSDGIYPCSACHDPKDKVNGARRELQMHNGPGEPETVLAHGAERWCLDCHDAQNRDVLRSASGQAIPFTESYRLCGQCHGDKYRDWKVGVHGKRIGMWDGAKTYFLCVNCHNPHTPRWKGVNDRLVDGKRVVSPTLELLQPEPMPARPEEQRMTAEEIQKARDARRPAPQQVHP
jgi:hypothetical protein